MTEDPEEDYGQGREGAKAALLEVVQEDAILKQFPPAARLSFEDADYEAIINLAWRYQFDDDRTKFKRGINELQAHISPTIAARLELSPE